MMMMIQRVLIGGYYPSVHTPVQLHNARPAGEHTCAITIVQSTDRWTIHTHLHRKVTFAPLHHAHVLLQ